MDLSNGEHKPSVSIIMPVYNAKKYLGDAISSILCQSYTDYELILIDDGASDGSDELCDYYASQDSRIVVIHQDNMGICAARNAGLRVARGTWIAFCDHDDLYLDDYLQTIMNAVEDNNEAVDLIKFGFETIVNSKTHNYHLFTTSPDGSYVVNEVVQKYELLNLCVKAMWNGLYKASIIHNNSLNFDTFFRSGVEDYDFNLSYLPMCNKILTLSNTLFVHYMRDGQSTDTFFSMNKLLSWERAAKKEHFLIRYYCDGQDQKRQLLRNREKYLTSIMCCLLSKKCSISLDEKTSYLDGLCDRIQEYDIQTYCDLSGLIHLGIIRFVEMLLFEKRHFVFLIGYMKMKMTVGEMIHQFKMRI